MSAITQLQYQQMLARTAQNSGRLPVSEDSVSDESTLHSEIIQLCKNRGWIYFHGSMAHRAMRTIGEPDFTILADKGRVFFFEAKSKSGKLSSQQLALKVWAEKLGHTIHTISTFRQFIQIITDDK